MSSPTSAPGHADAGQIEGLRQRGKRQRQQRIYDAAASLLQEMTFDEITTRQVAAEAAIGEATLFRYIGTKQELLTLVYGDQLDRVLDQIERDDASAIENARGSAPTGAGFIQRVLDAYRSRCAFYLRSPVNAARYLRAGFVIGGADIARHHAQGDRSIRLVTAILRDGQEAGVLAPLDVEIVAQNCHATYIHEIDRTPVRGYPPAEIWQRLEPRLRVQLEPLARDLT